MTQSCGSPLAPALISQAQLTVQAQSWHLAVLADLEARLAGDPGFPCVFSKNAFRKQLLKFIFVETLQPADILHLASGLGAYVELSRQWDGSLDTAYPLIVAFSHQAVKADSVAGYHSHGWKVLQKLHEVDSAPWPALVGQDPESPTWSMCFGGMPLFCNMSSPAHLARRSRNLGAHFIMVINPRERFDIFAGDTPGGRNVRANIRNRIARYDDQPHALQLGAYGDGALEWWQYGLVEQNIERSDRCPFRQIKN